MRPLLTIIAAATGAAGAALSGTSDPAGNRLDQRACDNVFAKPDELGALGTQQAKQMPHYLTNNPLPNGKPWAQMNCVNTNPYNTRPDTGVTRTYNFTISKQQASPDGVENTLLLVNGQFPGPTIEANWGDWIEVAVTNALEDDGTTIHWHGLLQQETPWMDGVPGVNQCPIAPGQTFTYRFRADLYGTGWYHSHVEAQFASGLYGPMVIYGPTHVDYDVDLGPVVVADYYHEYYQDILEGYLSKELRITKSDNNLINGRNPYQGNCAPRSSFSFTSGKKMRMRFINPSSYAVQKISIDGHKLTVIANDYVPIQPYETSVITLGPGQRADAIVVAQGKPTDAVWLRAFKPPSCSPSQPNSNEALAAIFYEKADKTKAPATKAGKDAYNTFCGNDPLSQTVPVFPIAPGDPTITEIMPISVRSNGSAYLWYMANETFEADYNDPILLDVNQGHLDFPAKRVVHNYGNAQSVRMVMENPGDQPHPIHLHGHNFFVLQQGDCKSDTVSKDFENKDQSNVVSAKVNLVVATNSANPPASSATLPVVSKRHLNSPSGVGKRQFWGGWGGWNTQQQTQQQQDYWGENTQDNSWSNSLADIWGGLQDIWGGKRWQGSNPQPGQNPQPDQNPQPGQNPQPSNSPKPGQQYDGGPGGDSPGNNNDGSKETNSGGNGNSSDSKGSDSKGSDSKGSDSKGSDSKGSDSKGSDSGSSPDKSQKYGNCWDGTIVNQNNPLRRDTFMLLPGQYVVFQWFLDNPGVWPLHCHIAWHASAGFAMLVLEQPDVIKTDTTIPPTVAETCPNWEKWTSDNTVPQIGDGIKMI